MVHKILHLSYGNSNILKHHQKITQNYIVMHSSFSSKIAI